MRKILLWITILACLLTGCTGLDGPELYTQAWFSLFDTVTTVVGTAGSEEAFRELVEPIREELEHYHRLFDIYNNYEGLNNLKTLNDTAALAPVPVDGEILSLLADCKTYAAVTDGAFNPAMGSVLTLWHTAREEKRLPEESALQAASAHMDPEDIVLDFENSTVFFRDPALKLDVGAIAKGWALQRICERAPKGLLISVGGNVCATGPKGEKPWSVGIQDPAGGSSYLHILQITGGSVVTSGSYQRNFTLDGQVYHHIIDPDTLYPGTRWTSVSVVCPDSGVADMLTTALFLLDREAGQALLEEYGAQAMWVDTVGQQFYSPDFPK